MPAAAVFLAAVLSLVPSARAQNDVSDVFEGLGTSSVVGEEAPARAAPGAGTIRGRVFDAESGTPIQGVTVIVLWPRPADGSEPPQEVQVTDLDGAFEFPSIPAGTYELSFVKSGYRASTMTNFAVKEGEVNKADFPMPPLATGKAENVMELEAFVVEATTVEEIMESLELRLESDEILNIMSAEDLSKYAASDVADALKRVAGVNIVEGQFAIIRGLEDRYSSTLYNGAPVPSPDPNRQSVQLDLFPSEVVGNLLVAKTFAPDLPSNSSGGSIDIQSLYYPEGLKLSLKGKAGFNDNAWDRFLAYQNGSPIGTEKDGDHTLQDEFGGSLGGRGELFGRELRFAAVLNQETDYATAEGFQETREPRIRFLPEDGQPPPGVLPRSGDLSLGVLSLSGGHYDLTTSERTKQDTAYLAFGFDLDTQAHHRIDASLFYTRKKDEAVQVKENGYLPNLDYDALIAKDAQGSDIGESDFNAFSTRGAFPGLGGVREQRNDFPERGALFFSTFNESRSFETKRDLLVYQANGDHTFEWLDNLHLSWAANTASTKQDEQAQGVQYFFEPEDKLGVQPRSIPAVVEELGPGNFASTANILFSTNDIEENQDFGRLDGDWEREIFDGVSVKLTSGGWYERAKRSVDSSFLESPTVNPISCGLSPNCSGANSQFAILGETPTDMAGHIFDELVRNEEGVLGGLRQTSNDSERKIWAWHGGLKATFFDQVDVLGGVRIENIEITSNNEPFIGERRFGAEETFPTRYLFFDRLDNPRQRTDPVTGVPFREVCVFPPGTFRCQGPPAGTVFNDQILGIAVPIDEETGLVDLTDEDLLTLINGQIDEMKYLPSVGITYRPLPGLNLRGAWSRTVARPSFREMGFYVSVEPGTDDLIVGNPQLGLSDVESFDARAEYSWGDQGDLVAFSAFYKTIDDPIESIVVRNPLNQEASSSALYRTFFNNPSQATLWGIELEARKSIDFLGLDALKYLSLGGNFTYIDATVDRTEAELARSERYFGLLDGDSTALLEEGGAPFTELAKSRRLFGQPEWIANADITFDHPDWGTQITLAYFAISDVLDAAGSASIGPAGQVLSFTLDRYIDSYYQLDLIMSQTVSFDALPGEWSLPSDIKFQVSIKNLTDSRRKILYDPVQTGGNVAERSYKIGRDYKFSVTYSFSF